MRTHLTALARRLTTLLRRRRLDRDLEDELAFHMAMKEEDLRRHGAGDARHAAARRFGNATRIREDLRALWTFPAIESVWADVRYASRRLIHDRAFSGVAVMALALGIGVNSTFFAMVYAICLRGLPIDDVDRVMVISSRDASDRQAGISFPEFVDLQRASASFEGVAAMGVAPMTIGDRDLPAERVLGAYVSADLFAVLRQRPIAGRGFIADDDRAAADVAILGHQVWTSRYGGDAAVVGRSISVNGQPVTVIGVMPEGFRFPGTADLWRPLAAMRGVTDQPRGARSLQVFARLKEDVPQTRASAELATLRAAWERDFADAGRGMRTRVVPINEQFNPPLMQRAWIAFITAGVLVLLVACANVANLLLMRGVARAHEMGVRASIGGTRARIIRQLLTESIVLAAAATGVGVALAHAPLRVLWALMPADALPYWMTFTLDYRAIGALALISLATVLLFGLAPALHLSRTDPGRALTAGGRGGTPGVVARRWMASFLAAECALTLVLLSMVVSDGRKGIAADRTEFHVDGSSVMTLWLTMPAPSYPTPESRIAFYDRLRERLTGLGAGTTIALAGSLPGGGGATQAIEVRGREINPDAKPTAMTAAVDGHFFDATGIPLRGAGFGRGQGTATGVVVNHRFVQTILGGDEPLGRYVRIGTAPDRPWLPIVGVVPTVRQASDDPVIYLPLETEAPATVALVARSSGDPTALTAPLRAAVAAIDDQLPLYRAMTLERAMAEAQWNPRMSVVLLRSITLVAMLLALVGLYAVAAHAVGQRRRELGVLAALGARPRQLQALVLRPAMRHVARGVALGVAATFAWEPLFDDVTQPIRMTDAATLLPLVAAVIVVATAACVIPARRAARVDPMSALRSE